MKKLLMLLLVVPMSLIFTGCLGGGGASSADPTDGPETATVEVADGRVAVTYQMADNLSDDLIRASAQMDTIELLGAAFAEHPEAESIAISGWFPMTDKFGNTEDSEILRVMYDQATLEQINFDGISTDSIWGLASESFIHPAIAG